MPVAARLLGMLVWIPPGVMDIYLVCYQVEVSVSGWSLVQRIPTDWSVSECDREAPSGKVMTWNRVEGSQGEKKIMARSDDYFPDRNNWIICQIQQQVFTVWGQIVVLLFVQDGLFFSWKSAFRIKSYFSAVDKAKSRIQKECSVEWPAFI